MESHASMFSHVRLRTNMRFASLFLAALPVLPATAAELVCELPSAKDGALLETMKLVALNGHVSRIWHKFERTSYWDEHFQSTTKSVGFAGSPDFTVVVTQNDPTTPPTTYYVDWGDARIAVVDVPFTREPIANVYFRWECKRAD
jgi:hypothetical protein